MASKKAKKKAKPKPGVRDIPAQRLRLFVESYTRNPNGAEAAQAAGYTGTAKARSEQASRLLERDDVQAMIADATAKAHAAAPGILTREERQRMWSAIARGEMTAPVVVGDAVMDIAPPWPVRLAALRDLAKAQGDFIEKVDISMTGRVETVARMPARDPPPTPDE
jgi:hypothetical protein